MFKKYLGLILASLGIGTGNNMHYRPKVEEVLREPKSVAIFVLNQKNKES